MKDDFNDNELDRAFRQSIEPMEVEPSSSFWQKAESGILSKEMFSFRKKLFLWKAVSSFFSVAVLVGVFYIFHLQNKLSLKENEMAVNTAISLKEILPEVKNETLLTKVENKFFPVPVFQAKEAVKSENIFASSETNHKKQFISEKNNSSGFPANTDMPIPGEKKNNIQKYSVETNSLTTTSSQEKNIYEESQAVKRNLFPESADKTNVDSSASASSIPNINPPKDLVVLLQELPQTNFLSKTSVFGFFSPSITNQFLKDNNSEDDLQADDMNQSEEDQFSYSAGIKIEYDLKNNWSVNTGCNYSVSSFNINPTSLYAKQGKNGDVSYSLVTSSGVVEIPSQGSTPIGDTLAIGNNSTQSLSFISIPLQLAYNYPVKRFVFYASAGASANILIDSQTDVNYQDDGLGDEEGGDTFESIDGLKKVHYGYSFGLGAKYMLTRKLFLSAEPSFSGALTPINKNVPMQSHPYFWALGLGVGYHF